MVLQRHAHQFLVIGTTGDGVAEILVDPVEDLDRAVLAEAECSLGLAGALEHFARHVARRGQGTSRYRLGSQAGLHWLSLLAVQYSDLHAIGGPLHRTREAARNGRLHVVQVVVY